MERWREEGAGLARREVEDAVVELGACAAGASGGREGCRVSRAAAAAAMACGRGGGNECTRPCGLGLEARA